MAIGDTLVRPMWVLPNDLGLNSNVNSSRYLSLLALMLMENCVRVGSAKVFIAKSWWRIADGSIVTQRRRLMAYQKFALRF